MQTMCESNSVEKIVDIQVLCSAVAGGYTSALVVGIFLCLNACTVWLQLSLHACHFQVDIDVILIIITDVSLWVFSSAFLLYLSIVLSEHSHLYDFSF